LQNRHRRLRANLPLLRRLVRAALAQMPGLTGYEVGIRLVDAAQMTAANRRFLRRAGPTDVIAFDYSAAPAPRSGAAGLHGDLLICLDVAQEHAKQFRTSGASELARYVVHGLLHLRGYDDADAPSRQAMKRAEDRLVRWLARRFPLRELVLERKLARTCKRKAAKPQSRKDESCGA
jgi:rRNA maturation RNase YbeY